MMRLELELELDCPSPPAAPHALDHVLNMSPTPVEPHNHHSSFCCNSNHTPKFQRNCVSLQSSMELMKEITTLEIEIMRLERYLLSLYRTAFQQNLPLLLENQKIHSQGKISSPTQCTTDQSYSDVEIDTSICGADQYDRISAAHALTGVSDKIQTANKSSSIREKLTDSAHRSLADHLTASRMDDVLSYPDRLSEEIVKCISCIYCKFANPKILATKGLSVSSTSSLSSSSTFSPRNLSGSWSSHHNEESTEQYEFEVCKDDNRPYSTMIEILKICLDDDSFNYATTMLHKFRSLVKSLEKVDPRNMRREEKLTFWINIHNALVMHAYLAYGTQNSVRSSSILKAAYNVGGHCVNAYVIQSSILGILPHYSAPWLRTLFSPGKKFATGNCRHTYAIEYPEPLVHFALSLGASSDPSIQVYTAKNVFQDLKVAKEEFIRATVCINKDKRIYLPKIICYFAKDMSLSTDEVVETVMGSLPETQMKLVRSCMEYRADKSSLEEISSQYQKFQLLLCAAEVSLHCGNNFKCIVHAKSALEMQLPDNYLFFVHLLLCRAYAVEDNYSGLHEEYIRCLEHKTDNHIGWICLKFLESRYKLQSDSSSLALAFQECGKEIKTSWNMWIAMYNLVQGLTAVWNGEFIDAEESLAQACLLAGGESCLFLSHGVICMEIARQQSDSDFLSLAIRSLKKAKDSSLMPLPFVSLLAPAEVSLGSESKWVKNLIEEW